jgi:F-type H+-transporting ATPase subunit epsilon
MALHFELVTPAKLVRSEEVHMVVVPVRKVSSACWKGMRPSFRPSPTAP